MQLVYYTNGQSELPYTLSSIIAECGEVKHRTVQRLINKHKTSLENFGKVRFQITPSKSGQNIKDYKLNEQQATLLITFMRNTEKVIEFKENLVKAFYDQRQLINELQIARAIEKPKRRELTDAIQAWKYFNEWSYTNFTNLLLTLTTGMSAKQIKEQHQSNRSSLDLLTVEQHEIYLDLENKLIVLIELDLPFKEIKEKLGGIAI